MIQNGISNIVNLLDNFMIGRVGTTSMSGVAIANQMMFVFYLMIFGATAGSGIFTAQYYGKGDIEGVRITFRFKFISNIILALAGSLVFFFGANFLVSRFLMGEGNVTDIEASLHIGVDYLHIMIISLIPIGISMAYSGTFRDIGMTKIPLLASSAAIAVNFVGNLLLIYGLLGLPALGAIGAAIATVISRFVELGVLVIYAATHKKKCPFIVGAFKHFRIPGKLAWTFTVKATPLLLNETAWAFGMTMLNQSYSYRSYDAVMAISIESSIYNVMTVAFIAMGEAVGMVIGQILGSGKIEEAKKNAIKMILFTVLPHDLQYYSTDKKACYISHFAQRNLHAVPVIYPCFVFRYKVRRKHSDHRSFRLRFRMDNLSSGSIHNEPLHEFICRMDGRHHHVC